LRKSKRQLTAPPSSNNVAQGTLRPSLFHYTSIEAALKIVESQTLLTSSRDQFNDPFDCQVPFVHKEQVPKLLNKIKEAVRSRRLGMPCRYGTLPQFEQLWPQFDVNSSTGVLISNVATEEVLADWVHKSLDDLALGLKDVAELIGSSARIISFGTSGTNLALWAYYAKSHQGVAIEFGFSNEDWEKHIFEVNYEQFEPNWLNETQWCDILFRKLSLADEAIKGTLQKKAFGTKSVDWAHEKEVRLVRFAVGSVEKRLPLGLSSDNFVRVLIGMSADPVLTNILVKICRSHQIPVARMVRSKDKFGVEPVEIAMGSVSQV
jgi:hypothetical protein